MNRLNQIETDRIESENIIINLWERGLLSDADADQRLKENLDWAKQKFRTACGLSAEPSCE